jgi:hypothetical protein
MNEITPPPSPEPSQPPENQPPNLPPVVVRSSEPPSKGWCTVIGFLLFLVTSGMSFALPPICVLGFIAAVVSLFFKGYRFIFLGYILPVGLLLLILIAYCSTHPLKFD